MPSTDRFWYLDALGVCFIIALSCVLFGSAGNDIGTFFTTDPASTWVLVVILGIVAIAFPVFAVLFSVRAARKLSRLRRRRRAVLGALDEAPLSLYIPDAGEPAQSVDDAGWPLSLLWRATAYRRREAGMYAVQALLAVALDAIVIAVAGSVVYAAFSPQYSARVRDVPLVLLALVFLAPVVLTPVLVVLARMLPTQFGRPFGVVADDDGITARMQFGGRAHLRWDEMRLLEITVAKDSLLSPPAGYAFTVFGEGGQIEWRDSYAVGFNPEYEPVGETLADAKRQARRMLALVMKRTGLPLRTLDPALQAPVVASPSAQAHANE